MRINGNGSKKTTIKIGKTMAATIDARETNPNKKNNASHVIITKARMTLKT